MMVTCYVKLVLVVLQVPVEVMVISATWGQGALTTLCSTLYIREDKGEHM